MLLVEFVCHSNSCVKVKYLLEYCSAVIVVCRVVNLATLNHHEEALLALFLKEVDSSRCNLCKGQVFFCAVDCIGELCGYILLVQHNLLCTFGLCKVVVITACYCIALLLGLAVDVFTCLVVAFHIAACIEVVACFKHPWSNLIVVVTAHVVRIEC